MRHDLAIILVLCGTLLVLAPPISDYMARKQQFELYAQRTDITSISYDSLSEEYRLSCFVLGSCMIGVGVLTSWRSSRNGAINDSHPDELT